MNQYSQEIDDLQMDELTWKAIISGGMGKLYGLVGQALYYEVTPQVGTRASIRIMKQDEKQFKNSLFTHRFKFSSYYGGSVDGQCYISQSK